MLNAACSKNDWLASMMMEHRQRLVVGMIAVFMSWKKENIQDLQGHDMLLYEMTYTKHECHFDTVCWAQTEPMETQGNCS